MKKLLLGSAALVVGGLMAAPAMAADPIKIGVGGYYTVLRNRGRHPSRLMPPMAAGPSYRGLPVPAGR